tara:strand:+ start:1929 stop:2549 length:621 start_codon:yes stop_codon:yes gene_type:complete
VAVIKITVVLAVLIGTFVIACSNAAPVPTPLPTGTEIPEPTSLLTATALPEPTAVATSTPVPNPTTTRVRSTSTPVPVITPTPWPRFKGTCPEVFPDAISIPYKEYFDGLIDGYDGIGDRKTYSYVSPTGSVARNGPFATWYYEMSIAYASAYVPTKFEVYTGHGHPGISWQDFVDYSEVLCDAGNDETLKRRVQLALDVLLDHTS